MMIKLRRVAQCSLLAIALCFSVQSNADTLHDLTNDWSDTVNPNGVWSVNAGATPLQPIADLSTTGIDGFPTPQPGFTGQPIFGDITPVWFKATGPLFNGNPDWQIGDIVTHTSRDFVPKSNVTWTSPSEGEIDILGGVWPTRPWFRTNDWILFLNETPLSSGTISDLILHNRANPFLFDNGSGGPSAVQDVVVSAGDVVKLEFQQQPGYIEDYVGVDIRILIAHSSAEDLLTGLIADIIALNLHQGISNSLDGKLSSAFDALTDLNENNDVSVLNRLNAFLNEVEAQRGNKISDANADFLVNAIQDIIDLL